MRSIKIIVYFLVVTLLVGGVHIASKKNAVPVKEELPVVIVPQGKPQFTWSYSSFEKDHIPQTILSLTASYQNGATTTKIIDTIEGGCNEYANRDADVYTSSQMIICYYAGLGRYYKVVENGNTYSVKRKVFEEGSPYYKPPVFLFETVSMF
jgi:hypothetical protein